MSSQRVLPQSKETLLQSYNKRLKDDIRSILDNFTEIIKTAKVEDETQVSRATQAEQEHYEMHVRAANISGCPYVGCGESYADHSTFHAQAKKHNLTVNLTTFRVWCYICEREVFLEHQPAVPTPSNHHCKPLEQGPVSQTVSRPLKAVPITVADEGESESEGDEFKPRGLTGMKNIGNSCYMNAALQALSNCPPLTQFFLECGGLVRTDKKPALCKSYQKLISELWHKKRPSYVVPTSLSHGIKLVNPMFRGYAQQSGCPYVGCGESYADHSTFHAQAKKHNLTVNLTTFRVWCYICEREVFLEQQPAVSTPSNHHCKPLEQDTQEFLRCLMDQLHEELKEPECGAESDREERRDGDRSPSEDEFLSCDSGASSDRGEGGEGILIQDESGGIRGGISEKERLKERRVSGSPRRGSSQEMDEDADIDTAAEEGGATRAGDSEDPPPNSVSKQNHRAVSEPDNDALLHSLSRSCSPSHGHQEAHPKLSSSPPRSSPLRIAGTAYSLKKGDNMYSCERCKKLRNGVKYCKVLRLPEILCIHLKRFRHEVMYSFKINSHVSFPLERLELRPFLDKESPSQITTYDLLSVICHHGTAGSGHYIAYCQNVINGQWYEFDDQYVTEVHETVVESAEAYVLFYRKSSKESEQERQKVVALANMKEPSLLQFYISREWLNKFNTFTEPGPIANHTFLCTHGGIPPNKYHYIDDLVVILPQSVWEYLYNSFGGGPAVNHIYVCSICQVEIEALAKRRKLEIETFIKLNKAFQAEESPSVIYCIGMQWFREWENFVKGKDNEPPGPTDNSRIAVMKGGHVQLKQGADYGQISEETWNYLFSIYGGGPEIAVRQSVSQPDTESLHGEHKIEAETRAL
ncbi:UNVERIFIED_CONTAM: hypothetical protein FKN15_020381 [Acipenser sinensis]